MNIPDSFLQLVEAIKLFPGIGTKSAERIAYHLQELNPLEINQFLEAIKSNISKLKKCQVCNVLNDHLVCEICASSNRNNGQLAIVENSKDLYAIEKLNQYNGRFYVIEKLISPKKDIGPDCLNIANIIDLISKNNIGEVILALNPTVDGELTSLYLHSVLKSDNLIVTRLASGLPMGANIEYADELTLFKALENRRKVKE